MEIFHMDKLGTHNSLRIYEVCIHMSIHVTDAIKAIHRLL